MLAAPSPLQRGRAAEHLVVADLLLQGYEAFLAEAGMPFDAVVVMDGALRRVQVKSTSASQSYDGSIFYRFQLRKGKGARQPLHAADLDLLAFVTLELRSIAYIPSQQLALENGMLPTCVDLLLDERDYATRGPTARARTGRFFADYSVACLTWNSTHRRCTTCWQTFPATVEFFRKNSRCSQGISGACRECSNKYAREWKQQKKAQHSQ
jgi:hypothetical protein